MRLSSNERRLTMTNISGRYLRSSGGSLSFRCFERKVTRVCVDADERSWRLILFFSFLDNDATISISIYNRRHGRCVISQDVSSNLSSMTSNDVPARRRRDSITCFLVFFFFFVNSRGIITADRVASTLRARGAPSNPIAAFRQYAAF